MSLCKHPDICSNRLTLNKKSLVCYYKYPLFPLTSQFRNIRLCATIIRLCYLRRISLICKLQVKVFYLVTFHDFLSENTLWFSKSFTVSFRGFYFWSGVNRLCGSLKIRESFPQRLETRILPVFRVIKGHRRIAFLLPAMLKSFLKDYSLAKINPIRVSVLVPLRKHSSLFSVI